MMSPKTFHEFYYPLYKELCEHVHSYGMHFWLHSCGDNTPLMDDLIAAGVDIFHPVQRFTMDERATSLKYGDKISFLAGADVQILLPETTEAECRAGVREWIDMFYRPDGGLLLAAGNGILPDTPLENIRAMLEEVTLYGTEIYKDNVK
jgi:uroporphyrinogen decarboxylase